MATVVDCPQSNRAQWSFRLFGTPVRVKFWFWLTLLILGAERDLKGLLIWVAVCFVSILLHEMGHVLAFHYFHREAEVVLYGFGGLAIPNGDVEGTFPKVMVAAAGPAAGFCLAGLTFVIAKLTGGHVVIYWHLLLPHASAVLNYKLIVWS